jgi:choline-phosphate cytidylyltransferase
VPSSQKQPSESLAVEPISKDFITGTSATMDGSVLSDSELSDYDLVSEVSSSIADLHHIPGQTVYEPPPSQGAQDAWETVKLDKEDVRAYVRKALESSSYSSRPTESNGGGRFDERRTVRVYVDGSFEVFNAG